MSDVSRTFLTDSRAFLTQDYMPKIERCIARLNEEQVWFRDDGASNSIGHLLLHRGERLLEPRLRQPAAAQFEGEQQSRHEQDDGDEELVHLKHNNPCNRCSGAVSRICLCRTLKCST